MTGAQLEEITLLSGCLIDENRVRAAVEFSDSYQQSNLEFVLADSRGLEITRMLILENMEHHIEFTLHLRGKKPDYPLTLTCHRHQHDGQSHETQSVIVET